MTTMLTTTRLVITGAGALSPAGHGLAALTRPTVGGSSDDALAELAADLPPTSLWPVEDLGVEEHLGGKGVKHLDRTTKLALIACKQALASLDVPLTEDDGPRTGAVIGTSTGSIRSSSEFSRETLVQDKPYLVRANLFPNTVMNCCAGQIAIRNGLRGVNATLAGGSLSSLGAIRYARNMISGGHVDRVLVGGVEELSAQSAWAWHLSDVLAAGAAVGEGCAVFMVETPESAEAAGRVARAELLACEVGSAGAEGERVSLADRLAERIGDALLRSGISADEVGVVALGATGRVGLERIEQRAVREALGGPAEQVRVGDTVGETFSASGALQLAALLARWQTGAFPGEVALVTSIGHDGNHGCLVVRNVGP